MTRHDDPDWASHADDEAPEFAGTLRGGAESWSVDGKAHAPRFAGLTPEEERAGQTYAVSLPSAFIVGHVDYVRVVRLRPLGPTQTELEAQWLFLPEALEPGAADIDKIVAFGRQVLDEDAAICEVNQRGLASIRHRSGVLMPEEYCSSLAFHGLGARQACPGGAERRSRVKGLALPPDPAVRAPCRAPEDRCKALPVPDFSPARNGWAASEPLLVRDRVCLDRRSRLLRHEGGSLAVQSQQARCQQPPAALPKEVGVPHDVEHLLLDAGLSARGRLSATAAPDRCRAGRAGRDSRARAARRRSRRSLSSRTRLNHKTGSSSSRHEGGFAVRRAIEHAEGARVDVALHQEHLADLVGQRRPVGDHRAVGAAILGPDVRTTDVEQRVKLAERFGGGSPAGAMRTAIRDSTCRNSASRRR